jgi:AmmeMemoRadiSam system protein B
MVRKPAVAGLFYPSDRNELRELMTSLCGEAPEDKVKAKAILVPHAGYLYSGKTACDVYKRVHIPSRVVLLGTNHTGQGATVSLYSGEAWESPFGLVMVDRELKHLVAQHPLVSVEDTAHMYEHSLEVQIPFLQKYGKNPKILPLVISSMNYETAKELGRFLGAIIGGYDALIVISSDMSHYTDAEEARRKDEILISAMERLATDELYYKAVQYNISMCGFIPAVVGIEAAKFLGATRGLLVDYSNSGETTGDFTRVVAYLGMLFL